MLLLNLSPFFEWSIFYREGVSCNPSRLIFYNLLSLHFIEARKFHQFTRICYSCGIKPKQTKIITDLNKEVCSVACLFHQRIILSLRLFRKTKQTNYSNFLYWAYFTCCCLFLLIHDWTPLCLLNACRSRRVSWTCSISLEWIAKFAMCSLSSVNSKLGIAWAWICLSGAAYARKCQHTTASIATGIAKLATDFRSTGFSRTSTFCNPLPFNGFAKYW